MNAHRATSEAPRQRGISLVELLVSLAIAALLLAALAGITAQVDQAQAFTGDRNALAEDARFAMERMVQAVRNTRALMLPFPDNLNTNWREHIREQTIPPSPPEGNSTLATAVLAVTVHAGQDLDGDGVPDADDDGDGRIDEDLGSDNTNDDAAGIVGIDDDGDGSVDETNKEDDDEDEDGSGGKDEEVRNGLDDDGDGAIDEDLDGDMNKDGAAGVAGVDDDGDGQVDETNSEDDDEDEDDAGDKDEDFYNTVVFYLSGAKLVERTPVPWDESGADGIGGEDFIESTLAENVTRFRIERVPDNATRAQLVDLTLELTSPAGETISVHTRIRVGSAL